MNIFREIVEHVNLKSVVVVMCIAGALGIAYVDKEQRNAFMTIAVTATGGFFGAEVPAALKRTSKTQTPNKTEEEVEVK